MDNDKFNALKQFIIANCIGKYDIKDIVAEVYNLYQDYKITEEQESELYLLVDPEEKEKAPAMLWFDDHGCVDIWEFVVFN